MQKKLRATKKKNLVKGKPKKATEPEKPKKATATKEKQAAKAKPRKPKAEHVGEGERPLGCPTCRFGRLGCKKCRNPNYKPRGPRKSRPA